MSLRQNSREPDFARLPRRPHCNPKLRRSRACDEFMAAVAARGVLDLAREDGDRVGPFSLPQRM
eukprot:631762-Pyramimonas_sp.AAC.1